MKTLCLTIVVAAALLAAPQVNAQCVTSSPNFSSGFRGASAVNEELNDLGRIFADAGSASATCVEQAHWALRDKVQNMLNGGPDSTGAIPFQRWLDGYYVALIYGAAFRLGERGWATKELDYVLDWNPTGAPTVASRFKHFEGVPNSGVCGPNTWNTCMDDHTGTAVGYAWIAAYKTKRPNHNNWTYDIKPKRDKASEHIANAFTAVCIRKKPVATSGTPVCNGTLSELAGGLAETFSVNGTQQLLHYGFGMMTSIGSALHVLDTVVGAPHYLTPTEVTIAQGLFDEMRAHADAAGTFPSLNCFKPNGSGVITGADCAGPDKYVPNLYRLEPVYRKYFSYTPTGGYTSTTFSSSLFKRYSTTPANEHFSYGRFATYYDMGYLWIENGVPKFPGDANDPIGYFESISSTGLAQGWACDKDLGDRQGAIKVDFYINGGIYPPIKSGWADSASEAIINGPSYCNGGTAHRFWVQLPPETQGYTVRAWALDYTWYGTYELPCLAPAGCRW